MLRWLMALATLAAASPAPAQIRIFSATVDEGAETVRAAPNNFTNGAETLVRIGGIDPGAKVDLGIGSVMDAEQQAQVTAMPVPTRCRGRIISVPGSELSKTAGADGFVTYRFRMRFEVPDDGSNASVNGPCTGVVPIIVTTREIKPIIGRPGFTGPRKPTAETTFMILRTPAVTLRPWTVYRYDDTWKLRRFFNFTMRGEGLSTCSGTSIGPSLYPVGPHERNGDLAVQIRSGPLGTTCRAGSPGVAMPEDVKLVAIDWAIERDGTKCVAGQDASNKVGEYVVIGPGHLPSDNVSLYMGGPQPTFSPLLGVTQPTLRTGQHIIGFAHAWMWCDKTLINDHGVRIVLRSATFEGPANADMP